MTNKEAFEITVTEFEWEKVKLSMILKDRDIPSSLDKSMQYLTTCAMALEKQIPKEPIGDLHSCPHYRCPICREGVKMYEDSLTFPFCHHCGQALDWRKLNDE